MRRRDLLTATAAAGLATAIPGFRIAPAHAEGHGHGLAAAQRFSIGEITVTALSDGFFPLEPEALIGITAERFAELLAEAYLPEGAHIAAVNAYLIETGDRRILIDAGTGTLFGPTLGQLAGNMAALGLAPGDVDTLIATHLHPDHIGSVLLDGGNPFANATLVVSEADRAFWTDADIRAGAPEEFQGTFDLAAGAVAAFGERVETVSGEAALGPGLTAIPLPGHTPGHIGVMVESGGQQLLIWGDVVHVPPVQFAMPEVTIGFDSDQDLARATRAEIMDRAVADRLMVAGMHLSFPGVGYVERRTDAGYHFVPAPWQYG